MNRCETASRLANRRKSILRAQFSVRSLFVLVTLAAVTLGFWRQFVDPYWFQRTAAETLIRAGGVCQVANGAPRWLHSLDLAQLEQHFQEIVALELSPEATLAHVNLLSRLSALQRLTVSGSAFRDEHLQSVGRHQHLKELTLRGSKVTPAAVCALQESRPDLAITLGTLDVGFGDLRFDLEPNQKFERSLLTPKILGIDGSHVRIKGVMFPHRKSARHPAICGPEQVRVHVRPRNRANGSVRVNRRRDEGWFISELYNGAYRCGRRH